MEREMLPVILICAAGTDALCIPATLEPVKTHEECVATIAVTNILDRFPQGAWVYSVECNWRVGGKS
jgi:hypothetical protein